MSTPKDAVLKELLERKETGSGPHPPRAMDHLALALVAAGGTELPEALAAIARIRRAFIDWNEARVARGQELARALGAVPGAETTARKLKDAYNAFFDRKGALNFDFLTLGKPAESKRALSQLFPALGKGAVALLLYEFCPGSPLPLSDEGLKQARRDAAVGKQGDRSQLARALGEQLEPPEAALLLQYWEIEATGSPYGEPLKKDAPKKGGKAPAKGRAKQA